MAANPTAGWDKVPVWGTLMEIDDITPKEGTVRLTVTGRVTRVDGQRIYPVNGVITRTLGVIDTADQAVHDQVRAALRATAIASGDWTGAAWDAWWAAGAGGRWFAQFPATDDPNIVEHDWQVKVEEQVRGGQEYYINPTLADLPSGINTGLVAVPPGAPTSLGPVYQKGVAGGVAALDADGDVVDALGAKVGSGLDETALGTYLTANVTPVIAAKAPIASPTFTGTVSGVTKTHVGLGSVDNTSDASKPVSMAQATAIALKAPLASPAFTGTPTGITKAHVGLSSVDDTADSAKPVSTAQAAAIALKAPVASPTFTGTVSGVTKTHVGLANVDNTSDANKPVSTAQAAADALRPLKSEMWRTVVKSGGTWAAWQAGWAGHIWVGADPSPLDMVAGDIRDIPA